MPIATASPSSFTVFTDALVDSGKEYIYQLSEVNIFGKEGPKSDTLAAKTLDGGAILNANYPPVDIFEEFLVFLNKIPRNNIEFGIKIITQRDKYYKIEITEISMYESTLTVLEHRIGVFFTFAFLYIECGSIQPAVPLFF